MHAAPSTNVCYRNLSYGNKEILYNGACHSPQCQARTSRPASRQRACLASLAMRGQRGAHSKYFKAAAPLLHLSPIADRAAVLPDTTPTAVATHPGHPECPDKADAPLIYQLYQSRSRLSCLAREPRGGAVLPRSALRWRAVAAPRWPPHQPSAGGPSPCARRASRPSSAALPSTACSRWTPRGWS